MKSLKQLREEKKWTQQELADKSAVSVITIHNLENKKVPSPQCEIRLKLENALQTRIDWLTTLGLGEAEQRTWEQVERDFRKALISANGLRDAERDQFLIVAREYIHTFESMIQQNDLDTSEHLIPPFM